MKSEDEIRSLYVQYLKRWAMADVKRQDDADKLMGMTAAYGRTLGMSFRRIEMEMKKARRLTEEKILTSSSLPTLRQSL